MVLAEITLGDAQALAAIGAVYSISVAFVGKVIMHLVDRNTALEGKVDGLHDELNKLHVEVREIAKMALATLSRVTDEDPPNA